MLAPVDDENRRVVPEAERRERFIKDLWKGGDVCRLALKLELGKWEQLFPR